VKCGVRGTAPARRDRRDGHSGEIPSPSDDGGNHPPVQLRALHAIEKLAIALLLRPRSVHATVPVPPLPFDSMCQDQPTLPLPPTVCAAPLNDTGALPVD
jgi:hypothetical protein